MLVLPSVDFALDFPCLLFKGVLEAAGSLTSFDFADARIENC